MNLTQELRQEYINLFQTCVTRPMYEDDVRFFINQLMQGIQKYEQVSASTGVPWYVIGLIHGMECGFSFAEHLHNGDSLKHRTVQEPAGRPPASVGDPPFDWTVSAIDALQYDSFTAWTDWSIAGICFKLEGYNGWGYRNHHPEVKSPYLWSYSNHYLRGKYVADGKWSSIAVSKQGGAITALNQMIKDHLVALNGTKANEGTTA
jgi:lysozyme family protein